MATHNTARRTGVVHILPAKLVIRLSVNSPFISAIMSMGNPCIHRYSCPMQRRGSRGWGTPSTISFPNAIHAWLGMHVLAMCRQPSSLRADMRIRPTLWRVSLKNTSAGNSAHVEGQRVFLLHGECLEPRRVFQNMRMIRWEFKILF